MIVRAGRPGGAEGPARSALALTNAHVVRPSAVAAGGDGAGPDARVVRVRTATGRWTVAAPIHISEGPLDVAVLAFAAASEDAGFVSAAVNPGADADPGDPRRRPRPRTRRTRRARRRRRRSSPRGWYPRWFVARPIRATW